MLGFRWWAELDIKSKVPKESKVPTIRRLSRTRRSNQNLNLNPVLCGFRCKLLYSMSITGQKKNSTSAPAPNNWPKNITVYTINEETRNH